MQINSYERIYRQRAITWRGATILIVGFLWTLLVFYSGYKYASGEPERLQIKIDEATAENDLLADLLKGANIEIEKAENDLKNTISHWQKKHINLKKNSVPASECHEEDDYYGTDAAKEFLEELNRLKESWLREND